MKGFEERLTRLEQLAETMRNRSVPLEEAMTLFDEGMEISAGLEKELQNFERKIEKLTNLPHTDGSEEVELEPF